MTFVSKKLRTLMSLVPVETPALGMALAGKARKFRDALFRSIALNQLFEIVPQKLIQTLAQGFGFAASALDQTIIYRKRDIHIHIIRVHMLCVKVTFGKTIKTGSLFGFVLCRCGGDGGRS